MCQALPGPRCAPHSRARLQKYQEKDATIQSELSNEIDKYRLGDSSPENQKVKARMDALNRQSREMSVKLKLVQRDYYGTPTGRRELEARLSNASHPVERDRIRKDIRDGKITRAWRVNALRRKKMGLPVNYDDLDLLINQPTSIAA